VSDTKPPLFLTDTELHELTGYKLGKPQIAWLKAHRWLYETNAGGKPRVARSYFDRRMVGVVTTPEPAPPSRHNFEALRVATGAPAITKRRSRSGR
jgi:hypothetical protein